MIIEQFLERIFSPKICLKIPAKKLLKTHFPLKFCSALKTFFLSSNKTIAKNKSSKLNCDIKISIYAPFIVFGGWTKHIIDPHRSTWSMRECCEVTKRFFIFFWKFVSIGWFSQNQLNFSQILITFEEILHKVIQIYS